MPQKTRIEYIDALRGFIMLLVVVGHIEYHGYKLWSDELLIKLHSPYFIISLIQMPLFFFISGYILFKKDFVWNPINTINFVKKKLRVLIIGTISWLFLFGTLSHLEICQWFGSMKLGYWFTITLFVYFLVYAVIKLACHIFSFCNEIENTLLIFAGLIGLAISPLAFFHKLEFNVKIWEYLDIKQLQYLQFFIFGTFCKKYNIQFFNIIKNNGWGATIILTFIATTIFLYQFNLHKNQICYYMMQYMYGYIGILLLFALFYKYQDIFTTQSKIGKTLQFIGRRTLDIYLIHAFIYPRNLDFVGNFFINYPNPILEFAFTLCLAFVVVGGCLTISQIIRLSPFLTYWLLGGKQMFTKDK